jgi:hypothetical protein
MSMITSPGTNWRALDCFAAIGHGFDREAVGDQQVAEQFAVEVVVLDNQNSFCH